MSQLEINRSVIKIDELNLNKNLNKFSNDYYKNLSNYGKTLSTNLQNDSIQQFKYYPCDKNLFYTVITVIINIRLLRRTCTEEGTSNQPTSL